MFKHIFMPFQKTAVTIGGLVLSFAAASASAHNGRNFEVQIVDDGLGGERLRLQGFNTQGPEMGVDPDGRASQYYGAIHEHFQFLAVGAEAEQPGFFVGGGVQDRLVGSSLTWELVGASKWVVDRSEILVDGTPMLRPGVDASDIELVALSGEETIFINSTRNSGFVASNNPGGAVLLTEAVVDAGTGFADDVEVTYDIGVQSLDAICVLEAVLSTDAAGIGASESFFTILSPDGANGRERLHFPSLLLESALGTAVPEPGVATLLLLVPAVAARRRAAVPA